MKATTTTYKLWDNNEISWSVKENSEACNIRFDKDFSSDVMFTSLHLQFILLM